MPASEESSRAPPNLIVLTGSAHPALGATVARELGLPLGGCRTERFADGEIHVEIDEREVEGQDVAIVQPTPNGGGRGSDAMLELLLIADACHRVGAATLFAVVPYFGYARQDARKRLGEPLGVRVATRILATAPFERLVTVDPHSDVLAGSLEIPMDSLSAGPLLVEALKADLPERDIVVVAPDLGAVKLAREYGRLLRSPVAVVHKVRTSGTDVSIERISGDVRGLRPIIVDDMISTGGTVAAAARALRNEGSQSEITVAATHAVLTPGVMDRLREAGLRRLFFTDTLAPSVSDSGVKVVSIAPLLATCIRRITTRARMAHFMLHP
jgi:ribose-phosphate pyrophosphokinase